jgi:hypothetical protein
MGSGILFRFGIACEQDIKVLAIRKYPMNLKKGYLYECVPIDVFCEETMAFRLSNLILLPVPGTFYFPCSFLLIAASAGDSASKENGTQHKVSRVFNKPFPPGTNFESLSHFPPPLKLNDPVNNFPDPGGSLLHRSLFIQPHV